jgi:integrase/recombinase XerC
MPDLMAPASGPPSLASPAHQRLLSAFLSGRSPRTLHAYGADLADFALWAGAADAADAARRLLAAGLGAANEAALNYRNALVGRGLAPATVNRRLAALRSLLQLARTLGLSAWSLEVAGVRGQTLRDTRGPGREGFKRL